MSMLTREEVNLGLQLRGCMQKPIKEPGVSMGDLWIDASKALPQFGERVLAWVPNFDNGEALCLAYSAGGFNIANLYKVTHWMRIEPPRAT